MDPLLIAIEKTKDEGNKINNQKPGSVYIMQIKLILVYLFSQLQNEFIKNYPEAQGVHTKLILIN